MPHPGILFMRMLAPVPLPVLRAFGAAIGHLLYLLAVPRRKVALKNLALCFPQWTEAKRRQLVRENFVYFTQAWLDRAWLWHAAPQTVRARVNLKGAVQELAGTDPVVIFAPHFYGLDAGGMALTQQVPRVFTTIYTTQRNPEVDAWIRRGRLRFGKARLFERTDGVKTIVAALRAGELLYLLPDMNFGPQESIFVPFYGVPAATVPSLSRFARLGRAKVVPVISRMTPQGYDVEVYPAWANFPTDDVEADTARMNRELEAFIDTMPAQYYWVHKRFKTRPAGEPAVY